MNDETIKLMGDAMKSATQFINRQSEFNKSVTEKVIELKKQVDKLTERMEKDNE